MEENLIGKELLIVPFKIKIVNILPEEHEIHLEVTFIILGLTNLVIWNIEDIQRLTMLVNFIRKELGFKDE